MQLSRQDKTSSFCSRFYLVLSILVLSVTLVFSSDVYALNLSGYAKSFIVSQDKVSNPIFDAPSSWQSQNSVRVMAEHIGARAVFQLHYEVSPILRSRQLPVADSTFSTVGGSYRLSDIETSLSNSSAKNQVFQNLDRFNIQWQFDHGDLTIGRQAISLGSARIINPTDVFLPFDVQTFNTEYRTGVDAIRYQRPMGELGEFDIGVILGEDAGRDTSAIFLQLRGNVDGKDLQFAAIEFAKQSLIGAGIQSAIGDMGFWFEIAQVSGDVDYVRTSIGIDYAFTESSFFQLEYHYNGAGADDTKDYLPLLSTTPYNKGGVFLLGEHYLIPAFSVQVSPLLSIGAQALVNLSDNSAFASASLEYNALENVYIDLGIYNFSGDDLTVNRVGLPLLESEYGANPNVVYASLRYYF